MPSISTCSLRIVVSLILLYVIPSHHSTQQITDLPSAIPILTWNPSVIPSLTDPDQGAHRRRRRVDQRSHDEATPFNIVG